MRPVYTANGFQCFLLSVAAFLVFSDASPHGVGLFPATLVYDSYGEILTALTLGSFAFCGALYVKGLVAPSGPDGGSCGNPVIDFYWGLELYPRIAGWDVKQFTNCRWGMMCWALFPLSFAAKSMALSGGALHPAMAVNVALQLVYVAKFFWWETGYLATMDIQHDRAGWYICWGCLVWVPSVYVSHSLFLVHAAPAWCTPAAAAAIFAAGWAAIYINYDADRQRGLARETNGQCIIWGHAARTLPAEYRTEGVRDNRRRGARAREEGARAITLAPRLRPLRAGRGQDDHPPRRRLVVRVAPLPLRARNPRRAVLVAARRLHARAALLLRHFSHHPPRRPRVPRRGPHARKVRRVLGCVRQGRAVENCPRRSLKSRRTAAGAALPAAPGRRPHCCMVVADYFAAARAGPCAQLGVVSIRGGVTTPNLRKLPRNTHALILPRSAPARGYQLIVRAPPPPPRAGAGAGPRAHSCCGGHCCWPRGAWPPPPSYSP